MHRLSTIALSLLLIVMGAVALAAVLIPAVTGTRAVTIDRTSMQRLIPVGSLAFIKDEPRYAINDIVTYQLGTNVITHQIVAFVPNPATGAVDGEWLLTKGTENEDADAPINRSQILGRVTLHAPYLGVAVKTLGAPVVEAFLAILGFGLYLASRRPRPTRKDPTPDFFRPAATPSPRP